MKKKITYIFFLLLAVVLVWLPLRNISSEQQEQIINSFSKVNYWIIIPVFIIGLFSHISRAYRWRMLIATKHEQAPPLSQTFFAIMIGYLANLAVPRLGEVLRCGVIHRYHKAPIATLIGTMLIERAVDLLFLVGIIFLTAATQFPILNSYLQKNKIIEMLYNKVSWSNALLLLTFGTICFLALYMIKRQAQKNNTLQQVQFKINELFEGIKSIKRLPNPLLFWFHSAFIWLMYLSMMYLAFYCLPETHHLGWKHALMLLSLGSIGMLATQGGLGAYPLLIAAALSLYQIPFSPIGLAFGWIIWVAQTIIILILGVTSLISLPIFHKEK